MKIMATKSFCGPLCMSKGEIREVTDKALLADLLRAGYAVEIGEPAKAEAPKAEKPEPVERKKAEAPKRGSRKKAVSAT